MNETSHEWSSQLSTVLSISERGTDRGSRTLSDNNGRLSSGFPITQSRQVLSISSSVAPEETGLRSRSNSLESPQPAFARGQRYLCNSSALIVGDQDEHGDGITDMQQWPPRTYVAGSYSASSSDNGRTNTMRSTGNSRANTLLANSIPTWAKLYYGSGERRS